MFTGSARLLVTLASAGLTILLYVHVVGENAVYALAPDWLESITAGWMQAMRILMSFALVLLLRYMITCSLLALAWMLVGSTTIRHKIKDMVLWWQLD